MQFNEVEGFVRLVKTFNSKNTNTQLLLKDNQLLVGSSNGIFKLDLKQNSTSQLFSQQLTGKTRQLLKDKDNQLFIATQSGLWKLDGNFNQLTPVDLSEIELNNSKQIEFNRIYSDNEGILWLSINDEGLYSYHPARNKLMRKRFNIPEQKNTQLIRIVEDDQLMISNRDSSYLSGIDRTINHPVYAYLQTNNEHYLGAKGDIIYIDQDQNEHQITYSKDSTFPNENITGILDDSLGRFWIVSQRSGLNISTFESNQFVSQNNNIAIPLETRVLIRFITKLSTNKIILASRNALYQYNTDTNKLEMLQSFNTQDISINRFTRSQGELFLHSTNDSIYTYNLNSGDFNQLDIPVDNIGCLIRQQQSLLIAQSKGSLYHWKNNQLRTIEISEGLPKGGLNGKMCINHQGHAYFSAFDGLYRYQPQANLINTVKPVTLIQSVELNHQNRLLSTLTNQALTMTAADFPIKFNLASSSYLMTSKNQYQYRFKNKGDQWNQLSSITRQALFDALAPDTYQIEFRSSNNSGIWSDSVEFTLLVKPPIWLTIWAKVGYLILLLAVIYLFYSHKLKISQQRAEELEETVKRRTEALNHEKHIVEDLLSQKNEEFANISHEFRTPLTLILGPLAQVLKTNNNQQELERLNIVQRNGFRLLRMVDQLLNLETFRVKAITQKSPQPVGKKIQLLTDAFADLATEKKIRLETATIEDISFEFTPDAIEKIILNLLSNAVKYTLPGGQISVEAIRTTENEYRIKITDTGIGIPADKLESVFKRYHRVLDKNSEQVTGAGIGLSLVKSLVETHNGCVSIESQLGEGTMVTINLPIISEVETLSIVQHKNDEIIAMELMSLTSQTHQSLPEIQTSSQLIADGKPSVLVIEDNQDMRQYIIGSINGDFQVLSAKDGEEGVNIAINEIPDLIISDVMMPNKDGYQTAHELRSNRVTNHIPIILLTARGDRESRLKGWQKRADEYLTKPFDVEELKIRLNNLLEIRNILKKRFGEYAFHTPPAISPTEVDEKQSSSGLEQERLINQLNKVLETEYADPNTSISSLAIAMAMSERQFFRKLKSILDMTPAEYLRRFRLEKAKVLLEQGLSINSVAFDVGFSSQSYFGKCFKAQFGISPTKFKKR